MLTSDLAQSWQRGTRTGPRLIETTAATHLRTAEELIQLVRLHRGRTRRQRIIAWLLALAVFGYIVAVAVAHEPFPWLLSRGMT